MIPPGTEDVICMKEVFCFEKEKYAVTNNGGAGYAGGDQHYSRKISGNTRRRGYAIQL